MFTVKILCGLLALHKNSNGLPNTMLHRWSSGKTTIRLLQHYKVRSFLPSVNLSTDKGEAFSTGTSHYYWQVDPAPYSLDDGNVFFFQIYNVRIAQCLCAQIPIRSDLHHLSVIDTLYSQSVEANMLAGCCHDV